jgi:hypothetical protein
MAEPIKYNNLSIELKPVRYRYPMSSDQMNDTMDMIYWNMVELLGYEHTDGTKQPSGVLLELYANIDGFIGGITGISASGYTKALSVSSGYIDNLCTRNNSILGSLNSMVRWYKPVI